MYYCDRCWIALEPEHELSCDDLKDELIHPFVSIPILLHPEIIEKGLAFRKLPKTLFWFKKEFLLDNESINVFKKNLRSKVLPHHF